MNDTKTMNPLAFALDFEKKGVQLYLKLAQETENILAKRLYYSLASQEVTHAKSIDEFSQQLKGQNPGEPSVSQELPPVEIELKEFFTQAAKGDLKTSPDITKGYSLAMDMEKKGFAAYKKFLDAAQNDTERKFFQHMLEEEKSHLDALANVYLYLTNTGDWLEEDESKTWNWMNQ